MNQHQNIRTDAATAERRAYLQGKRAALHLALQDFLDAKRAGTLAGTTEGAWRHEIEKAERELDALADVTLKRGPVVPDENHVKDTRPGHFSNPEGVGDYGDTFLGTTASDTLHRCRNHLDLLSTLLGEQREGGLNLSEPATQALADTLGHVFSAMNEQISVIDAHAEAFDREHAGQQS